MNAPRRPPAGSARQSRPRGQLGLRDFRIGYGDEEILQIPALDFPARSITALVGPVAAGKSSLLRHVAGLSYLTPSCWHTGRVLLDGREIADDASPGSTGIALMPQKARLYSGTVLENLGIAADDDRLAWWLGLLGLQDRLRERLDWDVGLLSLAMHRIVLLLRMLLDHPKVLLLDEPLSDVSMSDEGWLLETLRKLSGRVTVLMISHNKAHARAVADHIALLSGGELVEFGPSDAFHDAPSTALGRAWLENGSVWPPPRWDDDAPLPPAPEHPPVFSPRSLGFQWIVPGRLGGMHQPGMLNDLDGDLAAVSRLGIDRLITLTEAPLALDGADTHGVAIEHFPIGDMDAPMMKPCIAFLERLCSEYAAGANLVFHCRGGLGRTGLMLACFLIVRKNLGSGAAIEQVRRTNINYIQSSKQLAFVQAFGERWRARSSA